MSSPLLAIALAFAGGVLAAAAAPLPAGGLLSMGLLGAAAAWGRKRPPRLAAAGLLLLWACAGALRFRVWQAHPMHRLHARLPEEPQAIRLQGRLISEPTEIMAWPGAAADDRQAATLEVRYCRDAEQWQRCEGRLSAYLTAPRVALSAGDEVLLEGRWQRTRPAGNPGQYDRRAAGARRGIYGVVRVSSSDGLVVLRPGRPNWPARGIAWLQQRWEALLARAFHEPQTGLWRSLLLGQRTALDEGLERAFVETGTIHLLVVSGFNVGLIALLLEWGLRLAGLPFRARLMIAAIALAGYSAVTGAQPPVVRATVMAWVVLGGLALDRDLHWPTVWGAALLALLLVGPTQLWDPSFQLSFGAVACLIWLSPGLVGWLEARAAPVFPRWLRRYLALNLGATLAISVGLAPVLAWYFFLVTPVALLANLLLVPLFSALIAAGTGLLILATGWPEALLATRAALSLLLDVTLALVRWCQTWPGGHWVVGKPSVVWMAAYYGLLALTLLWRRRKVPAAVIVAAWLFAGLAWCGVAAWHRWGMPPRLRIDVLDVGHGDSALLRLPGGQTLLVDAGTEEAARARVLPFLRHEGLRRLDGLLLTHPDADHIGGAPAVLAELPVGALLTNGAEDDTMAARRVRAWRQDRGVPLRVLHAGMSLGAGPQAQVDVLHPPRGLIAGVPPEANDNSIVLRVVMGDVRVLLTGDLEEQGLPALLQSGQALQTTVLKVPHHGSRLGAAGEAFFARVQPQWALLSVGRLHRLPARETLAALARTGAVVYSTRDQGALRLETDGRRLTLRTFR